MDTERELCEKIQGAQGFIVFSHGTESPVGSVIANCKATIHGPDLPPLRVIGHCTREVWIAQRVRYYDAEVPLYAPPNRYYHKCVLDDGQVRQ